MNHINLNGTEYPVYWVGSAVRRFWQDVDVKHFSSVVEKIFKAQKKEDVSITDSELFDVIIPSVKWGIWGGQRFTNDPQPPMSDDDIADMFWPHDMDKGLEALGYFLESMPNNQNGQEVEEVEKKN